ncbi:hypothetical protein Tco_0940972, partial [Tanacetum coccineum]
RNYIYGRLQIQQEILSVLSTHLIDVLASVVPLTPTNQTPPPIPTTSTITTTKAHTFTSVNPKSKTLSAPQLRVSDLEKEVKELKQANLSTKLHVSIRYEVPSVVNEYLGSRVADLIKHKKRPHDDDDDRDQDPPIRPDQGLKKRKTSKDVEPPKKPKLTGSSKSNTLTQPKPTCKSAQAEEIDWFKKPARPPTPDPEWSIRKSVDDEPEQNWLNDLDNAEKPPRSFDDLMSTLIDFSTFAINRLKISKMKKANLVGLVYNLLKGTCKSCMELEYNMEKCYRTLYDQVYWKNPEGD